MTLEEMDAMGLVKYKEPEPQPEPKHYIYLMDPQTKEVTRKLMRCDGHLGSVREDC